MSPDYHLAQVNIARMRGTVTDVVMAGLVDQIDEMNRLAEESTGFVWRAGTQPAATDVDILRECLVPWDASRLFFNMSVWETIDSLRQYVVNSRHRDMLRARRQWIEHIDGVHSALWWLPARQVPTITDAAARLGLLQTSGPTHEAFTLQHPFPPPPYGWRHR